MQALDWAGRIIETSYTCWRCRGPKPAGCSICWFCHYSDCPRVMGERALMPSMPKRDAPWVPSDTTVPQAIQDGLRALGHVSVANPYMASELRFSPDDESMFEV